MAVTPRDVEDIIISMQNTYADIDPTIDLSKGPMAVLLYAVAQELARVEVQAGYLQTVYQLENADTLDDEDIDALGRNYGIDPDVGDSSTVVVTLWRTSRPIPGEVYSASLGDLVGTEDGRFVFSLEDDVIMNGNTPDIYYNAEEKRYEISANARAVSIGDDFNLPTNTITRLITDIEDFDGVVNPSSAQGGNDPPDKVQFRNYLWNRLQGINSDAGGALVTQVLDIDPSGITDLKLVSSADMDIFERTASLNGKLGYDIYIITDQVEPRVQNKVANGGELSIALDRAPVDSVQNVIVDGVSVPFSLVKDPRPDVRNSPRANDRVVLVTALEPGQTAEIRYFYYRNVWEAERSFQGRTTPFATDVMVRLAYQVPVFIGAEMVVIATDDRDAVQNQVIEFTRAYLRDPLSPSLYRRTFVDILEPSDYQESVLANVPGLSRFSLTSFVRIDQAASDIELITLDGKTEYPVMAPNIFLG